MTGKTRSEDRAGYTCARDGDALSQPASNAVLTLLYVNQRRAVRAYCARLLGDPTLAEDATHEVFLRVGRSLEQFPELGESRAWLFRIATNYCLNELRNRSVRARIPPQLAPLPGNSEDALAARNDARRLLARLPPRTRAVALLTYVDGMLQHEVAETLGVSRRTVVNCLSRVRASAAVCSRAALSL